MPNPDLPLLYGELAEWFHLLTAPGDYAEEAEFYGDLAVEACAFEPRTLLELGSGGGNSASHYKRRFAATLVDRSPAMLSVSLRLNPECEHLEGDMRTARLGRLFDVVLVHDAVMYLATEAELRACMATAYEHCRPGGAAVFAPDDVRETFEPGIETGGHDGDGRGLRYLAWRWDPDPGDTSYVVDFAYLLREGVDVRAVHDRHVFGVFGYGDWLAWLRDAGFDDVYSRRLETHGADVFVARRSRAT